jgi:hypothetical protein
VWRCDIVVATVVLLPMTACSNQAGPTCLAAAGQGFDSGNLSDSAGNDLLGTHAGGGRSS